MEENRDIQKQGAQNMPEEKEPGSLRLILTLGIAGFVSGIILVAAYLYTLPLIEANKAAVIERAIYKVLPECVSYKTLILKNGLIAEYSAPGKKAVSKANAPVLIYAGYNESGEMIGFAIPGAEPGFQDIISVMIGYDASKKSIIGFEVLECKETPGLGDKIIKDSKFQDNFKALLIAPEILFAKKGEKNNANEVEGITGATISSKAVIRLLNNSVKTWEAPIDAYVKTNANRLTIK